MANRDGVATTTLGGRTSTAVAVLGSQATAPYAPHNLQHSSTLAVWLTCLVDGPGDSDIQWQVSTDPAFGTTAWTLTSTNKANGLVTVVTSTLAEGTKYYWRTRSAATGTTGWGPWSTVWSFTPDTGAGRGYAYVYVNAGAELVLDRDVTAIGYIDINVGFEVILDHDQPEYVLGNVGVEITKRSEAVDYAFEGDVNTATPTPHIWFLRPTSGREGDGIQVVGFGFGDLQSTYGGALEYRPDGTWEVLPVTSWQTFPATPDAYGPDRELNEELGTIDMQHQVVEFTVPVGSESPGFPVRMKTNGS